MAPRTGWEHAGAQAADGDVANWSVLMLGHQLTVTSHFSLSSDLPCQRATDMGTITKEVETAITSSADNPFSSTVLTKFTAECCEAAWTWQTPYRPKDVICTSYSVKLHEFCNF